MGYPLLPAPCYMINALANELQRYWKVDKNIIEYVICCTKSSPEFRLINDSIVVEIYVFESVSGRQVL